MSHALSTKLPRHFAQCPGRSLALAEVFWAADGGGLARAVFWMKYDEGTERFVCQKRNTKWEK